MSGLLLDTHALIWWSARSPRLSASAARAIEAHAGEVWISPATIYEADYKSRAGRIPLLPASTIEIIRAEGFSCLPIDERDAAKGAEFDSPHADPFDRLIAAQALTHDMPVVTKDSLIASFGVRVIW